MRVHSCEYRSEGEQTVNPPNTCAKLAGIKNQDSVTSPNHLPTCPIHTGSSHKSKGRSQTGHLIILNNYMPCSKCACCNLGSASLCPDSNNNADPYLTAAPTQLSIIRATPGHLHVGSRTTRGHKSSAHGKSEQVPLTCCS